MKTDHQIYEKGNELARLFYRAMGCEVPRGYRFDRACHPQERSCWNLAVIAYEHIDGTDLENAADSEEGG